MREILPVNDRDETWRSQPFGKMTVAMFPLTVASPAVRLIVRTIKALLKRAPKLLWRVLDIALNPKAHLRQVQTSRMQTRPSSRAQNTLGRHAS